MRATTPTVLLGVALSGWTLLLGVGCTSQPASGGASSPEPSTPQATETSSPPPGLAFEPPAPGSYELPPIQAATDGRVVAIDGTRQRLFDHLGDRHVVLSFIYTQCIDPEGCPLARIVFHKLHRALESDPELTEEARLVTLSFDPERDTPEVLRSYAQAGRKEKAEEDDSWIFLTTASKADLQPILDGYGQYVVPEVDENGEPTGVLSHVLKVYLIDRDLQVRNVYSTSYLHPELVVNDLKTLLMEEAEVAEAEPTNEEAAG